MVAVTQSQVVIARSAAGLWSIRPRTGRNYRDPIIPESVRPVYGTYTLDQEFAGYQGAAQRFRTTFSLINTRGMDNMDGLFTAMTDEVSTIKRFLLRWPLPHKTESGAANPRVDAKAAEGANSVRCVANSTPPRVGRLVNFALNDKLYRITHAPVGLQTSTYSIGVYPNLIKDVNAGATVRADVVEGYVRFINNPVITQSQGIIFESVCTVQETLRT